MLDLATAGFIAISVVAVAQFTSDDPCNPPAREVPGAACAEVAIPAILDDIAATGSDFEIASAADGIVTRDELDSAADATVTCATDAGIANVGAYNPSQVDKSILESIYGILAEDPENGYGFRMSVRDDPAAEAAAFELCEARYMDRIAMLWHYQQVVAKR